MRAILVLAIVVAVLALVALIPIGCRVEYAQPGVKAWARICGVPILLFPREKKSPEDGRKKKEKKGKKAKKKKEKQPDGQSSKQGGTVKLVLSLLPIAVEALGALKKRIRIDNLEAHYVAGGEDAAQVALSYGKISGGAGAVLAILNQNFKVKRQEVTVDVNFLAEEATIYLDAALSIRVGQVVYLAVRYGVASLRVFLRHKKAQKASAAQKTERQEETKNTAESK